MHMQLGTEEYLTLWHWRQYT